MSRSTQLVVANIAHFLSVNLYYFSLSRDRRLELESEKEINMSDDTWTGSQSSIVTHQLSP